MNHQAYPKTEKSLYSMLGDHDVEAVKAWIDRNIEKNGATPECFGFINISLRNEALAIQKSKERGGNLVFQDGPLIEVFDYLVNIVPDALRNQFIDHFLEKFCTETTPRLVLYILEKGGYGPSRPVRPLIISMIAYKGDKGVLSHVLNTGPNLKETTHPGLISAVEGGHMDLVPLLIRHGADIQVENINQNTVLHALVRYVYGDIDGAQASDDQVKAWFSILIDHGADENAPDRDGNTPAQLAASFGCERSLKGLSGAIVERDARTLDESTIASRAPRKSQRL